MLRTTHTLRHTTTVIPVRCVRRTTATARRAARGAVASANGFSSLFSPSKSSEYLVLWPTTFGEAPSAIAALKQDRTVVINLNNMTCPEQQQRFVDFTAGGCHAMGGEQGMLAEGVFIFTPMGVSVHTMGSAAPLIEEAPAPVEYEQRHQQLAASTAAAAEAPVERELPPVPNMPVPGQVRAPGGRGSLYHQQGGESPLLASDPYSAVQARYR